MTPGPPRKRLHFTAEFDAHDLRHLVRLIDEMSLDIEQEGREERDLMSGDGRYSVTVREPTMDPERYERELMKWFDARRAARSVPIGQEAEHG